MMANVHSEPCAQWRRGLGIASRLARTQGGERTGTRERWQLERSRVSDAWHGTGAEATWRGDSYG